jgi:hypothetical protein
MIERSIVRPCWFCNGRIRLSPSEAPCDTCEGHGRIRIDYGVDAAGGMTQVVSPQPDEPLPVLHQREAAKRRAAKRAAASQASGAPASE